MLIEKSLKEKINRAILFETVEQALINLKKLFPTSNVSYDGKYFIVDHMKFCVETDPEILLESHREDALGELHRTDAILKKYEQ